MTNTENINRTIAQIAVEAVANDPEAFASYTIETVRAAGRAAGVADLYMDMLPAEPAREVRNPWNNKTIECSECGWDKFYDRGRSLDTFNHECAECGKMTHTMTETGMSA